MIILIVEDLESEILVSSRILIIIYYMALACGRYNARSDWLIVTEL